MANRKKEDTSKKINNQDIGERNDQYDQKKEKKVVRRIVLGIITVLIILVLVLGFTGYRFYTTSLEPVNKANTEEIQIEIPSGSSSTDIAKILEKNNIIKSASVFNIYTRINHESNFRAGYYLFSPSMDIDQIIHQLQTGGSDVAFGSSHPVTIREGVGIDQIAEAIEKSTVYSADDFLELIQSKAFLNQMLDKYPDLLESAMDAKNTKYVLEGYLYPATYDYYEDMDLETLVESMLAKTNSILKDDYAKIKEQGRTVQEILTIASLVEREAIHDEDRTRVAGVFYNRLEAEMPLQSDISVLYALNLHKEKVTLEDLKVDSPYNLYAHTGYGPGPFNSPSKASILAALNPQESKDLYFLADLKTGKVYFAETYQEHLENKAAYLD